MQADYARHTGRLIYVAMDRFDVQFAVKQLARRMCDADQFSWIALKRVFRYLKQAGPQ